MHNFKQLLTFYSQYSRLQLRTRKVVKSQYFDPSKTKITITKPRTNKISKQKNHKSF